MSISLGKASADTLAEVVEAVASWQQEGGPVQLHPGDVGWHWRLGTEAVARALTVWRRDGVALAVGLVDDGVIRMALAPSVDQDAGFAARVLADLSDPDPASVLAGAVSTVEARSGVALRRLLRESGWAPDELWTPLRRSLAEEVEDSGLRVEVVDPANVRARVAVQRNAFASSTFSVDRWHTMAAAPPYGRASCLLAYNAMEEPVAAVTVWSAGAGRPGLLEPLGVDHRHRGRGHGTAISVAAASALRAMGASSATVCTPSSNAGAVAAYVSAGFERLPEVADFRRPA